MKKLIFLITLLTISILSFSQDSLYVYRTGGRIEAKSVASVDSIKFNLAKDSLLFYKLGVATAMEFGFVDSISFIRVNTVQSTVKDKGVVINGVCWATRNVASTGTFVTNPQDYGYFYMWNKKTGISQTSSTATNSMWTGGYSPVNYNTDTWTAANDPSPTGWRAPTKAELNSLCSGTKVSYEWTTLNGVYGAKFTDKTTLQSMFLPAVGYKDGTSICLQGSSGYYWSGNAGTVEGDWSIGGNTSTNGGTRLWFKSGISTYSIDGDMRYYAFSIRPVIR